MSTSEETTPEVPPEQDPTPEVSGKERSAVYTEAIARLRSKYRDEFDGYLQEGYARLGIEWKPRPNELQKARVEVERLLSEHPELRQLFAIGSDQQ